MRKANTDIRPYIRQFYKGNRWRHALAAVQTVLNAACNLMLAWLIQQTIDLMSGADTGFTLGQLAAASGAYHGSDCRRLRLRLLVEAPLYFTGNRTV